MNFSLNLRVVKKKMASVNMNYDIKIEDVQELIDNQFNIARTKAFDISYYSVYHTYDEVSSLWFVCYHMYFKVWWGIICRLQLGVSKCQLIILISQVTTYSHNHMEIKTSQCLSLVQTQTPPQLLQLIVGSMLANGFLQPSVNAMSTG